ncbi:uncharacterized protein LOC144194248 isoform X3 [Stigmatopora nigra]
MKRKRILRNINMDEVKFTSSAWKMFFMPKWWISVAFLAGLLPPPCCGVHVLVRDEKKYAVLFQPVVLPCNFNSVSTQTPIVQWVYKSYCRDRTRDSFGFSQSLSAGSGGAGLPGIAHPDGKKAAYLDCSDSGRTVRTVASVSGSSVTLSEYYKDRDVSVINKADLRISQVRWGDSGVYTCKVIIADDVVGQNEASVELLVLGLSGLPEDLLPGFELKMMPEWLFVGAVALGSVLFLLLVGVCWCQCCPHSCCCYVRCCCCPETCCCPKHLYEAGKGITTGTTPLPYPPYFVTGVPAMVPIAPPSLVEKMSSLPTSDTSILTAAGATSELSSLHDGEPAFRQTFRHVQKKALPPIPDEPPEQRRYRDDRSPEPRRFRDAGPSSPQRYREPVEAEPRRHVEETRRPRRYSDDAPPSSQSRGHLHDARQQNHIEESRPRWNPRSEHLERKSYNPAERTVSLDELEEFAATYKQRGRKRDDEPDHRDSGRPSTRRAPLRHPYDDELGDASDREDRPRRMKNDHDISPLASPQKRRGTWGVERSLSPPPVAAGPPSTSSQEKDYDATFLNSLLERKSKLRGVKSGARSGEDDSDAPSRGSSKKSSEESGRRSCKSPGDGPPPDWPAPRLEAEPSQYDEPSPRPLHARPPLPPAPSPLNRRGETRDKPRKVQGTLLSRDSLVV